MSIHEEHRSHRSGWLRAAVLGANDGIVSTASLIIGVASAEATQQSIVLAGVAGLVAGAMSMAAGEYVSVSSQSDTEKADLEQEKESLKSNYEFELNELAYIYEQRGVDAGLAKQVAEQLMAYDSLASHARDEIGITDISIARPLQAAFYSAITFTLGALLPLIAAWLVPHQWIIQSVAILSLLFLASLGTIAAKAGGAPILRAAIRVLFWGALAMIMTYMVGQFFGVLV
ncbi:MULTISPECIES: VIT1/CCC1 transporter family protein [Vibrio]|uniref:VIT1/CCC1 transporter family protein n=1 Tax=Vibrio TaxID=662 RepID=UPI0015F5F608|nr:MULTISPECIES: VIT family protein [Vibrio]MEC8374053.1 VIT family protein [Pseudomonadota bacterium]MBA5916806.1 VIT family protein [Vibrio parahaemolyticus]MBO1659487.1 VIT family protein [Vibrio parahaemolyticus]MBY8081829.1 VIT family protein [Vibrio fluvialis]MCE7581020.1 VIT family protein [Vibrio fluvialis]